MCILRFKISIRNKLLILQYYESVYLKFLCYLSLFKPIFCFYKNKIFIRKLISQTEYSLRIMNMHKDILRLLIEKYFHDETVYSCQFVSKFCNSCITETRRYDAQCEKLAMNMREKQKKYFEKKRNRYITLAVNEKLKNLKGKRTITLRKLLKQKYLKQEGNPYCDYCSLIASPNEISLHIIKHANYHLDNYTRITCQVCGCINPDDIGSPHFKEGCPHTKSYCFCGTLAPNKFHEYHCGYKKF